MRATQKPTHSQRNRRRRRPQSAQGTNLASSNENRRTKHGAQHRINVDLARVWESKTKKGFITALGWGEGVAVEKVAPDHVEVKVTKFVEQPDGSVKGERVSGFIVPPKGIRAADVVIKKSLSNVLKIDFGDVQPFFGFNRAAFGIVMIRTDGVRLLVYTTAARQS